MAAPVAIVLMKNPIGARKMAQAVECSGLQAVVAHDVAQLEDLIDRAMPIFVCVPDTDVDGALIALQRHAGVRLFAYTEDTQPELFLRAFESPSIGGIFGVRYPGAGPRIWELLGVARRLLTGGVPPPNAPLSWGHEWCELVLSGSVDREGAVRHAAEFAGRFITGRLQDAIAQVADELIMNAVYDAPTDRNGHARFAHARKQPVALAREEQPTLGFGCDGMRLVISATDPFGALPRNAVFKGLHRGLSAGSIDTSGGGAGLGLMMICQTAKVVYFDIVPGRLTQVTTVVELDVPLRHLRKLPTSVHVFVHE